MILTHCPDPVTTLCKNAAHLNSIDPGAAIGAEAWLQEHVPRVCLPDPVLEQTYYFRWWIFRKHIQPTPDGTVITEFLPPVPWAGPYNTISAAVGHHIDEGRWLRNNSFLDEYIRFFYEKGYLHDYSNWLEAAVQGLWPVSKRRTCLPLRTAGQPARTISCPRAQNRLSPDFVNTLVLTLGVSDHSLMLNVAVGGQTAIGAEHAL